MNVEEERRSEVGKEKWRQREGQGEREEEKPVLPHPFRWGR